MKQFDVITLGEILLRYSPNDSERLSQCETLRRTIGGAELNVAAALSNMGCSTGIITKIPDSPNGIFAKNSIRSFGVSDDLLVYDDSPKKRIGVYHYEKGAAPRKPMVEYDRQNSSFCSLKLDEVNPEIFSNTKIFHTSGITLALGESIRNTAIEIIKAFKDAGAKISFDVNFRANLWSEKMARKTILNILPLVDIFFCSNETFRKTFKQTCPLGRIHSEFSDEYDISFIASTNRKVHSPKVHSFYSSFYVRDTHQVYRESAYENIEVVDRIGSGDAYIAGILYGMLKNPFDYQKMVEYGNAFSVLKNTVPGDILCSNIYEINSIIAAHKGKS